MFKLLNISYKINMDIETKNAYTEVVEILNNLPDGDKAKIPINLIKVLEENKNKDYKFKFDIKLSLNAQKISKKAKTILAVIFRDYLATSKQREKILKIEGLEMQKQDEIAKAKYNYDNLFKKTKNSRKN